MARITEYHCLMPYNVGIKHINSRDNFFTVGVKEKLEQKNKLCPGQADISIKHLSRFNEGALHIGD